MPQCCTLVAATTRPYYGCNQYVSSTKKSPRILIYSPHLAVRPYPIFCNNIHIMKRAGVESAAHTVCRLRVGLKATVWRSSCVGEGQYHRELCAGKVMMPRDRGWAGSGAAHGVGVQLLPSCQPTWVSGVSRQGFPVFGGLRLK